MANKKKAKEAAADSSLDKVTDYRFPEATRKAGLAGATTGPGWGRWPKAKVLKAGVAWAIRNDGHAPTSTAWRSSAEDHPNALRVYQLWGSWPAFRADVEAELQERQAKRLAKAGKGTADRS